MILQALKEYYDRKQDELPLEGFEKREVKFLIVISANGKFLDLTDMREGTKKKGKEYTLPKSKPRAGSKSWETTFLLWDHYGYVLGHPKDTDKHSVQMAENQRKVFIESIKSLPKDVKCDDGVRAVLAFYKKEQFAKVKNHPNWDDCASIPNCNLTFRLDGDRKLVPERPAIVRHQKSLVLLSHESEDSEAGGSQIGVCLVSGEKGPIVRLHSATPILGAKSNSKIVAFQKNSGFDSYGKEQAYNAPISIQSEAAISTALNHLIKSTTNRIIVGEETFVFWAEREKSEVNLEEMFPWVISTQAAAKDDPDKGVEVVKSLYTAIRNGKLSHEKDHRFYVLGLAPNAARISVRLWRTGTVQDFGLRIKQHFDDFAIIHGPKEYEYLTLYQILSSTALQNKMENVPPNLPGSVIGSILDGTPYPLTLIQRCILRVRAERFVNRQRAAILKACLNRFNRLHNPQKKEILMALDPSNTDIGYRVGRLFAVLEKIQEKAHPSLNATIRDRFYGAASSSPGTVFPQLLKLKNHHISKLPVEQKKYFEKLIGEIMAEIQVFPAHLSLNNQASFAVGYYHQKQDFFTSKKQG